MVLFEWFKWSGRLIKKKGVSPNVNIVETDLSSYAVSTQMLAIVMPSKKGPINTIKTYGPTIKRPKWYQFWRWYLIPKYNQQVQQGIEDFKKDFGDPTYSTDGAAYMDLLRSMRSDKLYTVRTKE